MHIFMWIIISILLAYSLYFLSVSEDKNKEFRENVLHQEEIVIPPLADIFSESHEKLSLLNQKINLKTIRLKISQNKIDETRRTISELQVTSKKLKLKYSELLKQLKAELFKKESECQSLLSQIVEIANKRDKLKMKYLKKQNYFLPTSVSESLSSKNTRPHGHSIKKNYSQTMADERQSF